MTWRRHALPQPPPGVSAWWVNLLVGVYLILRLIYAGVYLQNMGVPHRGIRTFTYVAGWAINVALIVMAIVALI